MPATPYESSPVGGSPEAIARMEAQGVAFLDRSAAPCNAYHPSLNVLSPREWFVTFDLGRTTESLDYHTRGLRTLDAGATWALEGPLIQKPDTPPATHTIRTRHFGDGRILGFGKWEDRRGYEQHRSNRATLGQVPMRLFWFESLDGGRTWSAPRWIEPPLVGPTWELCHAPVALPDGRLGLPVATWRGWNGELPNGEMTGILVSPDEGRSWPDFVTTFDGRQSGLIHWEQSVVVRRDRSLLATAWVYDPRRKETLPSVYSVSRDKGRNFEAPRPTGFLAQTCKILELRSGQVVAVYRRHDRPGLWGELATVDGNGWRTDRRALLWGAVTSGMSGQGSSSEELNTLRFGYPSLAELTDGTVLLVFWGAVSGPSGIRWMCFKPERFPSVAP